MLSKQSLYSAKYRRDDGKTNLGPRDLESRSVPAFFPPKTLTGIPGLKRNRTGY